MRPRNQRRIERIQFASPFSGKLGTIAVTIHDLSLFGARLVHAGPVPVGSQMTLRFVWKDEEITLACEILRCRVEIFGNGKGTMYNTGIRFADRLGAAQKLRELIASHVARALEEQKANARGMFRDYENNPIFKRGLLTINRADFAQTVEERQALGGESAKETTYISYRLEGRRWKKTKTRDPQQPEDGFTLVADEEESQVALLRETYELVDEEGRRLIRILSELSILGEGIPMGRFQP